MRKKNKLIALKTDSAKTNLEKELSIVGLARALFWGAVIIALSLFFVNAVLAVDFNKAKNPMAALGFMLN